MVVRGEVIRWEMVRQADPSVQSKEETAARVILEDTACF